MKISYASASDLKVTINGQTRILSCTDAQTAVKLKQALEATDGSILAVNQVITEFKK
jgi:hypothetical protein|nr:MAG TPA: hypothetical protein [Caudoviricetes sp.]